MFNITWPLAGKLGTTLMENARPCGSGELDGTKPRSPVMFRSPLLVMVTWANLLPGRPVMETELCTVNEKLEKVSWERATERFESAGCEMPT